MECGAYMPPYENITIYHMRDLVMGTKKVSTNNLYYTIHVFNYTNVEL